MDAKQEFNDFTTKFYGYGNLISRYSVIGDNLLAKIKQKTTNFNNMTENQRIEIMNTDPDFQEFQKNMNKLYAAYAQFFDFMNGAMKTSVPDNQPVQPKTELKSSPNAEKATIDSME
jgi:hypothetical protein